VWVGLPVDSAALKPLLRTGEAPLLWSAEEAVDVLRFALAAYESNDAGGIGVRPTHRAG